MLLHATQCAMQAVHYVDYLSTLRDQCVHTLCKFCQDNLLEVLSTPGVRAHSLWEGEWVWLLFHTYTILYVVIAKNKEADLWRKIYHCSIHAVCSL